MVSAGAESIKTTALSGPRTTSKPKSKRRWSRWERWSREPRYIKKEKPKSEQALRLRLLKVVRGNLPTKYVEAWKIYDKAREAYDKAQEAYAEAQEAHAKAWEAHVKAWEVYDKAGAYAKAWEAYDNEINALHAKECPDCPWNGTTIFTAPRL